MKRKNNYVMMKRSTPKRVTQARYIRVYRSRLPPHIKIRRMYRGVPVRQRVRGIASVIKILLLFRKKAAKYIITSSVAKSLTKKLANKALDKAPEVIDSLSNRTNNKTIKKY